ncbi:hypothetical protein UA45_02220 [Morganella morganii]|uniref:Uncharacterized protein n=1 Tax=Morganella morganii TaxID=582 RepID=A0A0D8LE08_MORMO|nr:hypothetical protein UA45_02220 [Morganella morganii]
MTVSTELSHEEYTGNGVTTDFDFRFRIFEAKHLVVSVANTDGTERILTNGTDYTLRGVGSYRGGKVILKMPLATGWKIGIARDLPAVQETDLRNQGKFFAEVHEDAFDYLTMLFQKSLGYLSLCLRKPSFISDHYDAKGNKISNLGKPVKDGDAVDLGTMKEHISEKDKRSLRVADKDIPVLPNTANRANKLLSFDDDGNPVVIMPESGSAADLLVELGKQGGASMIGTQHRRNLATDLDAIDRRPDGYDNNIHAVLDSGRDVEINKDYQSAIQVQLFNGQVVKGAGGSLRVTSNKQSAFRADVRGGGGTEAKDHIVIRDVRTLGSIQPDSTTEAIDAYSVRMIDNSYSLVSGLYSQGFTGGVALTNTRATTIENVIAKNTVYHNNAVRGAYAVFLDECRDTIINGIHFTARAGNDGRHLLYASNGGGGNTYNGCVNLISTNLIANYLDKDDRNMWAMNYRKSRRTIQSDFIIDGANGGVAYNPEQGDIEKNILTNGHIFVLKYDSSVGVYGVSQLFLEEYKINGFIASNLIIEVKPKNSNITNNACIGYAITGRNGLLNGIVTNVPKAGNPIIVLNGATNVLIADVLDYTNDGSNDEMKACITFGGDAGKMSNITVRGIKTSRRIFDRITAAVNVTVDFPRSAIINLTNGVKTLFDDYELIRSVSIGNASITVVFHDHVTQSAADMVSVRMRIEDGVDGYISISEISGKSVSVRFHSTNGTIINPVTAGMLSCLITLYS